MKLDILTDEILTKLATSRTANNWRQIAEAQAKLTLKQMVDEINLEYDDKGFIKFYPTREDWQALRELADA